MVFVITPSAVIYFLVLLFHWTDMLFTVLMLQKLKTKFVNTETFEINYHRFFFKKFGLIKGGIISCSISTSVLLFLISSVNPQVQTFILGMLFMIASINVTAYFSESRIKKEVQFTEEYKKVLRGKICVDCSKEYDELEVIR